MQVFNPNEPEIDLNDFLKFDWSHAVYVDGRGELVEEVPSDLPKALGKEFIIRMLVNSDHAGDQVTCRSRTGFLVFLNNALIYLTSKKKTTIETSLFKSEFMALKTGTEYLRGLRFKLRAMGIPVTKLVFVYGDSKSVLCNTTAPDSQLKKKLNSVAYHHCREGVALDEWRTCYLNTNENMSDMMTKPLPAGEKQENFCKKLFYFWGDNPNLEPSVEPSVDHRDKSVTVLAIELFPEEWITGFNRAGEHFELFD